MKDLVYYFPIILIVISNVFYNICTKSMPENANPFLSLLVTYTVAALLTLIFFLFTNSNKDLMLSFKSLNWTSVVLGICVVTLEFGYITAYRYGWHISLGSVVANISLAIILIPIGVLCYKEVLTLNHLIGIFLCSIGLFFINK